MPKTHRCNPALFEKDLTGEVIIVTGANSGCGLETCRQLLKQNATVVLACRNESKAQVALKDLDSDNASFIKLDLADLISVRSFVAKFIEAYNRLDVLVNNAGVMACPYGTTKDGFEMQFGSNHLGHFLLAHLLTPLLIKTSEDITNKPSKLVILSSCAASQMWMTKGDPEIYFDDMNWQKEGKKYSPLDAYQQSKLANCLHAMEVSRRYDSSKLMAFSIHPGWVRTSLDRHMIPSKCFENIIRNTLQWLGLMIPPDDGAQSTLHCVLSDAEDLVNGAFYAQFGPFKDKASRPGGWPLDLPNPNATSEVATKLWKESEKLVGIE